MRSDTDAGLGAEERLADVVAPPPPPTVPADGIRVDELVLRPPRTDDADALAPAFSDPDVGGEAGLPPFDAPTLRAVIDEQVAPLAATGALIPLVIVEAESGRILGGASYHQYSAMRQAIEIGYWLYGHGRGRGVATRVVRALAAHAFAHGVYRVNAVVRTGNVSSERVLERSGFTREGVLRRYLRYRGGRKDATLYSLLADEPPTWRE